MSENQAPQLLSTKSRRWAISALLEPINLLPYTRVNSSNTYPAWLIYDSLYTIPLDRFIHCLVDNIIEPLVISGKPPEDELQRAWDTIYTQYIDLSADQDLKFSFKLYRDILLLEARLLKVSSAVDVLSRGYDQEMVDLLVDSGFRYKFNFEDQASYIKDLRLVISSSKQWLIQKELKEKEYKAYTDKMQGKPPTREYFTSVLNNLSLWAHYRIDPYTTTAAEFTDLKKKYLEYHDQLDKQVSKQITSRRQNGM